MTEGSNGDRRQRIDIVPIEGITEPLGGDHERIWSGRGITDRNSNLTRWTGRSSKIGGSGGIMPPIDQMEIGDS